MKSLRELLPESEIVSVRGDLQIPVAGIAFHSAKVAQDFCYIAIKGFRHDGIDFLPEALAKGARAVVTMHPPLLGKNGLTWIQVKNDRRALSQMAAAWFNNPSQRMTVIGVTGTNGKTTTVSLIQTILARKEISGWIGTLGMGVGQEMRRTGLTTPEAPEIFSFLAELEEQGGQNAVMEVSSASLELQRVEEIRFAQAIFTSFSGDHLDFHQSMERYFQAKLSLFRRLASENWAIINLDDAKAQELLQEMDCRYLTFGFSADADIHPHKFHFSLQGTEALLRTPRGDLPITTPLIGRFNLLNVMAAIGSAIIKGIADEIIVRALQEAKPIKGRCQVAYSGAFQVLIDFAHTDMAMESLLSSLKEIAQGRILLVFGAGGSRDRTKRPRMGAAAARWADEIWITSDNPRQEEPTAIVAEIIAGIPAEFSTYHVEIDRRLAIEQAIGQAQRGDLLVIAGKGHEDYQIFRDRTVHFDDAEVVAEIVEKLACPK